MAGLHILLDARASLGLSDRQAVEDWLRYAASLAGMTIIGMQSHLLLSGLDNGPGVTAIAVIAESHMAVHTWPLEGIITMDMFSCRRFDALAIVESFTRTFGVTLILRYNEIPRWGPSVEGP